MKILFLLPPSEGKKSENNDFNEILSFHFKKPLDIAENVTEKYLKCSWKRFKEWLQLNRNINSWETIEAIKRYSWVMFNAIDYSWMNTSWKDFFENKFLILSWMYGIVEPLDKIWNYKLPIESKWLIDFWWDTVVKEINTLEVDYVVNLLPISYSKLILWKNKKLWEEFKKIRNFKIININFLKSDWNKISHWVKKIKWEWIKNICEKWIEDYKNFWWEVFEWENGVVDVNIMSK